MPNVNIPLQLFAGQIWEWADIQPASLDTQWTWAAKYVFIGPDQFEIAAVASGTTYTFTKRPPESKKIKPGQYTFHAVWNNQQNDPDDESVVVASGRVEILPDPVLQQGGVSNISFAREALASVEAAILAYSTKPATSITIAGRTIQRPTLAQLMKERGLLILEIRREEQAERVKRGLDPGGKILFRFEEAS